MQRMFQINILSSLLSKIRVLFFLIFAGFLSVSCSENPGNAPADPDPEPEPPNEISEGNLEITTITTGLDPDPRGYTIVIENAENHQAGANDTVQSDNLEEGTYTVELTDIQDHCAVESENPKTVDIIAGETSSIEFEINCKGIFRDKIVFFRAQSQSAIRYNKAQFVNSMATESYYTMSYDGSEIEKVTDLTHDGRVHFLSDISPGGTKMVISYSEKVGDSYANTRIAIVDAYDNEFTYLIEGSEDTHYFHPVFSPDGSKIAFTGYSDSGLFGDIYIMNADGSNLQNVTNSDELDRNPDWSPDGTQLVFQRSSKDYKNLGIYVINNDGSGLKRLIESDREFQNPVWSPKGDKIAMIGSRYDPYYYSEVYVMNTDGSDVKTVASKKGDNIYHGTPKWSPDGSQIAFVSNRDGVEDSDFGYAYAPMDIFKVNEDGSNLVNLTNTLNTEESNLMWSP